VKTLIEGNMVKEGNTSRTFGFTALQDFSYDFTTIPLKVDFRYQFFDAPDYENRFYIYERDVLYAFSIPMFSSIGSRFYLNLSYEINRKISLWFKFAQTIYADGRESTGSGNEEISGNTKTDLRCLLRWQF